MRKTGILLACIVLACLSCKKKEEEPKYSGEILLSSELLQSGQDYVFYGFSFEAGKISTYSITSSLMPDLAAIHVILGENITVDLSSSNDVDAFYKNGIFSTPEEAEAYFNNYTEVITHEFQPLAQNIKENQVWTVQTAGKRFAKIWIMEITYQSGSLSDFATVRIRYHYQPDGSRTFN
jgi:hypothetical protein